MNKYLNYFHMILKFSINAKTGMKLKINQKYHIKVLCSENYFYQYNTILAKNIIISNFNFALQK